jgi:NitT/TauT family transport system ATP-binding protein
MNSCSVEISDLTKFYGTLHVLDRLSLSVRQGEFISIVGPSGCGKSTLLKILGGLLEPTTGTVLLDGMAPTERRKQGYLGFVFQNPVLLPWRTLEENVRLPLEVLQRRPYSLSQVDEMIALVGLKGFGSAYPKQLSGGMQQRAALARALVYNPTLLLMDEPFGAVDELTRTRLNFELLQLWHSSKATVLFVTHALDEAVLLADRVVVLSPRPATIIADVRVDMPRPRGPSTIDTEAFAQTLQSVRKALDSRCAA